MTHPSGQNDAPVVFDRQALDAHRMRAAPGHGDHDFLMREVALRLVDRLDDTNRTFHTAAEFGCRGDIVRKALGARADGLQLTHCASDEALLPDKRDTRGASIVTDDEFVPFAPGSIDLALSVLNWHWVNDLPGLLVQVRRALRPDGLLLAAMLGGETLHELRHALMQAEEQVEGGVSPRVAPFADVPDAGALLQRAGFALPVVDADTITVTYADAFALMHELRGMGEANAVAARRRNFTRRETLMTAADIYHQTFGMADGRIPATFQVLYLTAWSPHESQQQPAARGSGRVSLADALKDD